MKNAREAGSPAAEIALEVAAAPEGGHRISVLDRGEGMSDRVLENATVPSFTTKPTGSGMGLALCRDIVDAHQGHLRIARRDGGGMAISFWLPARTAALQRNAEPSPTHADEGCQPIRRHLTDLRTTGGAILDDRGWHATWKAPAVWISRCSAEKSFPPSSGRCGRWRPPTVRSPSRSTSSSGCWPSSTAHRCRC